MVMSGGVFLAVFVDMCISLFLCFSSLVVGLVPHCGCEYLLLGVLVVGPVPHCGCIFSWVLTLFATVFVHRVVTSVRPIG